MVNKAALAKTSTMADDQPDRSAVAAERESVSVVIVVLTEEPGIVESYHAYRRALADSDRRIEFVYVLDQGKPKVFEELQALVEAGEPVKVAVLSRWDDEIGALQSGMRRASGEIILTLPAVPQVEPDELVKVIDAIEGVDMVAAQRPVYGRSWLYRVQDRLFHRTLRTLFGRPFRDLVCRVRAYRRATLEEILGYSTQQHFLPILAADRGFRIAEIDVAIRQSAGPHARFRSQLRLLSDMIALFFVLKFVRRPLRFFGAIGLPLLAGGLLFTGALAIGRLLFGMPLADRPALILGVLLIVLGIQTIALGLIGEIIVFASGKRTREYTVDRIL